MVPVQFGVRSSAFGVRSSVFGVRCSKFGVRIEVPSHVIPDSLAAALAGAGDRLGGFRERIRWYPEVDSTNDLAGVARNLAFSLALYTGQMCTAPQNIYVPRGGIATPDGHKSFDEVANAIDRGAHSFARRVHSQVTQEDQSVHVGPPEGRRDSVAPLAVGSLLVEQLRAPTLRCDARPLGGNVRR